MLKRFSILCILICLAFSAHAAIDIDQTDFGQLPVLHEGRLKPLQRLAEVSLRQISDGTYHAQSPSNWLALLVFTPAATQDMPMFAVPNTSVRQVLQLPANHAALYTYQELAVALSSQEQALTALSKRPANDLNRDEKALVRILENIALYQQLIHALDMIAALAIAADDPALPSAGIKDLQTPITYLQLQPYQKTLIDHAHALAKKDPSKLTERDVASARLAQILAEIHSNASSNNILRIFPPTWERKNGVWITPWQALQGQGGPSTLNDLQIWQQMLTAYQAEDLPKFNHAMQRWQQNLANTNVTPNHHLAWQAEHLYLTWPWLLGAGAGYFLTLLLIICHPQRSKAELGIQTKSFFWIPAHCARMTTHIIRIITILGILQHAAALGLRMLIMGRPPVSNLYESIIFVAFIVAGFGIIAQLRQRLKTLLVPALIIAIVLLAIDQFFIGDGDNLSPLIAVLNTKFWLATHVVCITLGYTACLLTAGYAHLQLLRNAWQKQPLEPPDIKLLKPLLHISLLLVATGTLLGGIWADQSWGRFWGWDPKENGALLISIWLLWLQHGALTGQLKTFGFTSGTVLLAPIVALSWFGVNLLGVGLHSYGFSSQTAWGLFIFIAAEILLVIFLVWRQKRIKVVPV